MEAVFYFSNLVFYYLVVSEAEVEAVDLIGGMRHRAKIIMTAPMDTALLELHYYY